MNVDWVKWHLKQKYNYFYFSFYKKIEQMNENTSNLIIIPKSYFCLSVISRYVPSFLFFEAYLVPIYWIIKPFRIGISLFQEIDYTISNISSTCICFHSCSKNLTSFCESTHSITFSCMIEVFNNFIVNNIYWDVTWPCWVVSISNTFHSSFKLIFDNSFNHIRRMNWMKSSDTMI